MTHWGSRERTAREPSKHLTTVITIFSRVGGRVGTGRPSSPAQQTKPLANRSENPQPSFLN
eukprot:8665449-Pyramimonas_sp.AAC.1